MCRGEISQLQDKFCANQSVLSYMRRIKRKTALLIAISCRLGGLTCQADSKVISSLSSYGYHAGMAFQLIDDVLDYTKEDTVLGKPAANDLRQGNITLPVIYALNQPESRPRLLSYVNSNGVAEPHADIVQLVHASGGIEYTTSLAGRFLDRALYSLYQLPDIEERAMLEQIAMFVVQRDY